MERIYLEMITNSENENEKIITKGKNEEIKIHENIELINHVNEEKNKDVKREEIKVL